MSPDDAFQATVFDAPGGPESLAPRLGMSAQILRNKANAYSTTNVAAGRDWDRVMGLTGDFRVLHALAKNHGFVCYEVDQSLCVSDMAILELVTKVWTTNGDVGAAVNSTLADGKVEQHELAVVRDAVYRLHQATMEMLSRLEGMAEK